MIESNAAAAAAAGAAATATPPLRRWGLKFNPFSGAPTPYVALSECEKTVDRLTRLVESGGPLGLLSGEPGLGKSVALSRLQQRLRAPGRRIVRISDPIDGDDLAAALAAVLGTSAGWRPLQGAVQVLNWQHTRLVVLIDECREFLNRSGSTDLKRLMNLGAESTTPATVILTAADEMDVLGRPELRDSLPARLHRLTRSDAAYYLACKLQAAGCTDDVFTPRALTRIHAASDGIPRALDRIASVCLNAGARQGPEMIGAEFVDAVVRELSPRPGE